MKRYPLNTLFAITATLTAAAIAVIFGGLSIITAVSADAFLITNTHTTMASNAECFRLLLLLLLKPSWQHRLAQNRHLLWTPAHLLLPATFFGRYRTTTGQYEKKRNSKVSQAQVRLTGLHECVKASDVESGRKSVEEKDEADGEQQQGSTIAHRCQHVSRHICVRHRHG